MIAAVAVVGRPSVSSGTSVPVADALLAASGPATPSIAPLPNSSGCLVSLRSIAYDRNVGISAPPAGSVPNGKPSAVPRSHGFHERAQSRALIITDPENFSSRSATRFKYVATYSVSPTANSPTATTTTSMPSSSSGMPSVKRAWPVCVSMPMRPR